MNKEVQSKKNAEALIQLNEQLSSSSTDYFTKIFKNGSECIIVADHLQLVKAWNLAAEQMFEYTASEVTGKPLTDFLNIDQETRDKNRIHFEKEGNWNGEVDITNRHDKKIKTLFSVSSIKNKEGIITDYIITIRNISEISHLQENLKNINATLEKKVEEGLQQILQVFERINDGFAAFDKDLNFIFANKFFEDLLNIPVEKLIGQNAVKKYGHLNSVQLVEKAFTSQQYLDTEYYSDIFKKWFRAKLYPSANGVTVYVSDITDTIRKEEELSKTNRLYQFISRTNELILHTKSADEIYQEICKIAVETGNFVFAWVGLPDTSTKLIKPYKIAGYENNYLQVGKVSYEDIPEGRGPTGRAFRMGKYYYCNDFEKDMAMSVWLPAALERGYHSSIAFPFKIDNTVVSVITLYSDKANFFSEEEIKMLERVTNNISFALNTIEIDRKRKAAEIQVIKLTQAIEQSPVSIVITDTAGKIEYVNTTFTNVTGYSAEEVIGENPKILKTGYTSEAEYNYMYQQLNHGKKWQGEFFNKKKNGDRYWEKVILSPLKDEHGKITNFMGIKEDISEKKKQEREIKKLVSLVEDSSSFIGTMFLNGKISYLNKAVRKIIEVGEFEDISDLDAADYFSNKIIPFKEMVSAVLSNGFWEGESIILSRTGKEIPVFQIVRLQTDAQGVPDLITCHAIDITELKNKQAESNRFRQIAENSIAYIGIANMNREVFYFNDSMRKTFNVPDGADLADYKVFQFYSDKGKEIIKNTFEKLMETGHWSGENEMQTLDGKIIPVMQTIILIKDEFGVPQFTSSTAIDISLLKEKEEVLWLSESKFRAILDNSFDAIGVHVNGIWDMCNPATLKLFGYQSIEELVGTPIINVIVPEEHERIGAFVRNRIKGLGAPTSYITRGLRKDKTEFDLEMSLSDFEKENRINVLVILRDITERRTHEKEMTRLNNELRELSSHLISVREEERSSIAKEIHDQLAQNLVALSMNASWLKTSIQHPSKEVEEILEEQLSIADGVISSSRNLFNTLHPSMLDELGIDAAIRWHAKTQLKLSNIQYNIHSNIPNEKLPKELNVVLFRIFQESLTNILRHAKATNLSVQILKEDKKVMMTIHDNGAGFDVNKVNMIQSHGLLGIRERVYALNGKLNIESIIGKGTTLTVEVPLE